MTDSAIHAPQRLNSQGYDMSNENALATLAQELNNYLSRQYVAYPLIANTQIPQLDNAKIVVNPANQLDNVGSVVYTREEQVATAIAQAVNAVNSWRKYTIEQRAAALNQMADLLELNRNELIGLLVREAGKTISNAISEIREAVDFCRYYAAQALAEFSGNNYTALGVVVCISPWNFPLAIFIGEISSALVVGNSVIAKPSNQTNLIAFFAVSLFHQAGIPQDVLQLLPGSGSVLGNLLTQDSRINGVIFTGSTETAQSINKNLAQHDSHSVLIAETGGQNAMIVDSSTLPEQVVADIVTSGFDSAGQRCSALRVLYLQAEIADKIIDMLKGVMDELNIGNPADLATDIGPVIDARSRDDLLAHIANMKTKNRTIYQARLSAQCQAGHFVPPTIIEIDNIHELAREVFGPIIHIIRFANDELAQIITQINSSGYGLTQGVHSRVSSTTKLVYENIHAGNIYVNRNMVGAVVGVQPFGGEGMSGTGPKAGGPLYLYRLVKTTHNPQLGQVMVANQPMAEKVQQFIAQLTMLSAKEQQDLSAYATKVCQATLLDKRVNLVGPTGEDNFMYFNG